MANERAVPGRALRTQQPRFALAFVPGDLRQLLDRDMPRVRDIQSSLLYDGSIKHLSPAKAVNQITSETS